MRTGERGYALLLAVAVVALLSVVLLSAARAQADLRASLTRLSAQQQEAIAIENAMARTAFILLTQPIGARAVTVAGAGELALDGRAYRADGLPGLRVSVQDEAGLINLNNPEEAALEALLNAAAMPAAAQRAAALADYVDEDDVRRARGAEAEDYARANLQPPPNAAIEVRWQAAEALGWRTALEHSQIWSAITAMPSGSGVNINTAPLIVLEALTGDAAAAQAILRRRASDPILDVNEAQALIGREDLQLAVQPGSSFRILVSFGAGETQRAGAVRSFSLTDGDQAPFRWTEDGRGHFDLQSQTDANARFPTDASAS